jgi:hypothetical protein
LALVIFGVFALGCGGSGRQLESISVSPSPAVAKNGTVQLVATGTYSSDPVTVSGIAVDWNPPLCVPTNTTACPQVIPAPEVNVNAKGLATCVKGFSGTATVEVAAPRDPSQPIDASGVATVTGKGSVICQ